LPFLISWSSTNFRLMFWWYNSNTASICIYNSHCNSLHNRQSGCKNDIMKLYFSYFGIISINKWWTTNILEAWKLSKLCEKTISKSNKLSKYTLNA
jgi:hypothetical protein